MSTTLFKNLDIVTLDRHSNIHHNADLVVTDRQITHIGTVPEGIQADITIDGRGRVAMPGFVNSHGHAAMALFRGWAERGFTDTFGWLQKVWQIEGHLEPEDVYWGSALAAAEMIRTGTVAFNDMYFHMDHVANVVQESGMKAALGWGFFDADEGADVPGFADTIEWVKAIDAKGYERVNTFIAPHAPYTVGEASLRQTVETAHALNKGIHIHIAETGAEVEQCLAQHKLRSVQYADHVGLFDVPGGCISAHTLHTDETDIAVLAEKGVHVTHSPISYSRLGYHGFPSIKAAVEAGVHISLATDGPASNSILDMFQVMRQTGFLARRIEQAPVLFGGDQLLRMATQAGAQALGFPDSGVLEVGAPADLILINIDAPHMRPIHDLVANLTFSANGSDVTDVMVDGKWLMRNRELQTLDEERILFETQKRAEKLATLVQSGQS